MISLTTIAFIVIPVLLILFVSSFVAKQYKRCPSNQVLVIYGAKRSKDGNSARYIHGGGAFVIPLIEEYQYLSLKPISFDVDLKDSLSKNNIRVNVPSTFTIAVSTDIAILENAGQRILGLTPEQIKELASDIVLGQLRLVIASMTIEEINSEREKFQQEINKNVEEELSKIGLEVLNVNLRDLTDKSGYLDAIGRKAAETAKQQALIDVAKQEKLGAIGKAKEGQEQRVQVANADAEAEKGEANAEAEKSIKIAEFRANQIKGENEAKARIAESDAILAVTQAENKKKGDVARAEAEKAILESQKAAKVAELQKDELAKEEVDKAKKIVQAEAEAETVRVVAEGEAQAILAKFKAEAEGTKAVLEAKALGYKNLVEACGGDGKLASNLLLIEKMESIVEKQMEALKQVKIDKITVWDSGAGSGQGAGGFKGFLKDYMTAAPAMADLARQTGMNLPAFLGTSVEESEVPKKDDEEKKS